MLDDTESRSELGGGPGTEHTHIELRGRPNKSYTGWDIRHRYIASTVYELPFGSGRKWTIQNAFLNGVAGGWGLGVVLESRSGVPYGVNEQTNRSNTFSAAVRPFLLRNPALPSNRSRSEMLAGYFDTSAFLAPADGVFGNAPRTICCGPGMFRLDVSVNKMFPVTERFKVQFRTDFFNLLNTANFDIPQGLRGAGDFGRIARILPESTGRQIQLSLRLEF